MLTNEEMEVNYQKYKDLLLSTKREGIEELVKSFDRTDLKTAPASTKYHNDFEGGLVLHCLNVYEEISKMKELIEKYDIPEDTLILTSLLHDICKINVYIEDTRNVKNKETGQWEQIPYWSFKDKQPWGHGEKSIILAQWYIKFRPVEVGMIRNHMGFARDEIIQVSNLFKECPEAVLLHNADMIATYIKETTV